MQQENPFVQNPVRRHLLVTFHSRTGDETMDLQFKTHRDVPYGWVLVAAAAWRAIRARGDRARAQPHHAAAAGLFQLSGPH
jgi:hypothetical protein